MGKGCEFHDRLKQIPGGGKVLIHDFRGEVSFPEKYNDRRCTTTREVLRSITDKGDAEHDIVMFRQPPRHDIFLP